MYAPKFIHAAVFAAAAALFAPADALAQVTIDLTTTQQTNCTVTTDSQGLRLVAGGSDLLATGVTLSGAGCQSGDGGAANFATAVQVPSTATAGTFNVTWGASADASQCTYGGTAGVSGWPVGTTACQGTACGTTHVTPVSVTSAGNYTFSMTCTNASGYALGSVAVSGTDHLPPAPANFALVAPATATTQIPFNVSWAVTGATSCTGQATLGGSSTSLAGWTDSVSPTSPRSVTAAAAGTYALTLTCSNSFGSVTSQTASVAVSQSDLSCPQSPLTQQVTGTIQYPPHVGTGYGSRTNVDLTHFENIWGHLSLTDPAELWPGQPGASPVITAFGRNQYIAAKFTVPTGTSTSLAGFFKNVSNFGGTNIDMSISTTCGDFTAAPAGCIKTNVPPSDTGAVYWRFSNPTNFYCELAPNTNYYLNIRMTNPGAASPNCAAGSPTCRLHTNNNFGQ